MIIEAAGNSTLRNSDGGSIVEHGSLSNLLYFPLSGLGWIKFTDVPYWGSWLATGTAGATAEFMIKDDDCFGFWMHQNAGFSLIALEVDGGAPDIWDMNSVSENYFQLNVCVANDGNWHSIKFTNIGTDPLYGGIPLNWMSILGVDTDGMLQEALTEMAAQFLVSATILGAQTVNTARSRKSMPFSVRYPVGALTLAQIIAVHDAVIQKLALVTGGEIISSNVQIFPALPSGINTDIIDGIRVQDGALLTFDLTGTPYVDSLFVPAIRPLLVGTDGLSILTGDDAITDLLSYLTTENGATPEAVNRFDKVYASLQAAGWVQRR